LLVFRGALATAEAREAFARLPSVRTRIVEYGPKDQEESPADVARGAPTARTTFGIFLLPQTQGFGKPLSRRDSEASRFEAEASGQRVRNWLWD